MKPIYLVFALLLLIVPVSAYPEGSSGLWYSYQPSITNYVTQSNTYGYFWDGSTSGLVMGNCEFTLNAGETAFFTLYMEDGSTVDGYILTEKDLFGAIVHKTTKIGTDVQTGTNVLDLFPNHFFLKYYIGELNDSDITYWITLGGDDIILGIPWGYHQLSKSVASNPVEKIHISSDTGIREVKIGTCPKESLEALEGEFLDTYSEIAENSWWDWLVGQMVGIKTIIFLFWQLFEFFIIKNFMLLVLMLEGGILAYRFCTARDIFTAIRLIMYDNKRLFFGIISTIREVVDLISQFNPIKWVLGR